jgi:DNA-binding beta-propeller fold protein YncE
MCSLFPSFAAWPLVAVALALSGAAPKQAGIDSLHAGDSVSVSAPEETGTTNEGLITGRGLSVRATGEQLGEGELREPLGLAVDIYGSIYVTDAMAGKVFRYSAPGRSIEFEQPATSGAIYPIDIDVYGNFIYVLDYLGNRILRYDNRGAYLDVLLSFARFERMQPVSMTAGEGGRIVTTDIVNHTLTVWTPLLELELTVGDYGWAEGSFDRPMKADILPDGGLAVIEAGNRRIQVLSPSGDYRWLIVPPAPVSFDTPRSVASDRDGNLFVSDPQGGTVVVLSSLGDLLLVIDSWQGSAISPSAAAVGWDNRLFVADLGSRSILVYRIIYQP